MTEINKTKVLAVIPARGGSKGLYRKNIRSINGLPLLAWSILTAQQAHSIDHIVVSTDDDEIAEVAAQFGAGVVKRPADISGDRASTESAIIHALESYSSEADRPDWVICMQCTSPLTLAEDIDGLFKKVDTEKADCGFIVAPFKGFVWEESAKEGWHGINHDPAYRPMRQDFASQFVETGSLYLLKADQFLESRHRFFGKIAAYPIPTERYVDVDTLNDFKIAETALRQLHGSVRLPFKPQALIMDFDGVFTDNTVMVNEQGEETVLCHRGDGLGISMLNDMTFPMLILSREVNPVVQARAGKLKLECISGCLDKLSALQEWVESRGIDLEKTLYIGNDINDLECMNAVGLAVAVADAEIEAKDAAQIVLNRKGGAGAIRELTGMIRLALIEGK